VVSDSYFFEMYGGGLAAKYFDNPFFWYYHRTALMYDSIEAPRDPQAYDLKAVLADTDVIILMSTSINLKDFPWAFDARAARELAN